MHDVFDIYTIIFLALAVFIFLRLRSVLGQRTGRERPPYDAFWGVLVGGGAVLVISLPNRTTAETAQKPVEASPATPPAERWKGVATEGSPLATGLDAIVGVEPEFDAKHFITGARAAYEMIVTAFAEGDKRSLKNLLSREVYEGFEAAINDREKKGHKVETRFVSIDTADITGAELRGRTAQVTVRFVS
jgi:predicted lipid-binding transport protein (Tim44 family)